MEKVIKLLNELNLYYKIEAGSIYVNLAPGASLVYADTVYFLIKDLLAVCVGSLSVHQIFRTGGQPD